MMNSMKVSPAKRSSHDRRRVWRRLLRSRRMQLAETSVLFACLAIAFLLVVHGGKLLSTTREYTARAILVPNDASNALNGRGTARPSALDASYLKAATLRSPDFLYAEIDRHKLGAVADLNNGWSANAMERSAAAYATLRHALTVRVLPNADIALVVTLGDPKLANGILRWMATDLREELRTERLAEMKRAELIANVNLIDHDAHPGAVSPERIAYVETVPDFAFTLKQEAPQVTESSGLFWPAVVTLALLILATFWMIVAYPIISRRRDRMMLRERHRRARFAG